MVKNKGGPRTVHKDNSHPLIKISLRKWIIDKACPINVLDVYGGHGMMYKRVWKNFEYETSNGDAVEYLNKKVYLDFDCYDIDPYSSPYEALEIICKKSKKTKIGVVCTDGMLRRQAGMRGNFTKFIQKKCGWPAKDNTLMAGVYHRYPEFLRHVISCVCADFEIENLAIKYGLKQSQATVYWAAVLKKKENN